MNILKPVKNFKLWLVTNLLKVDQRNNGHNCVIGTTDIAVPPLEVEFLHYELAHELGELCKKAAESRE